MRVRLVIAAGLALVAGLVLILLLVPGQRRAGSNYVPEFGPVMELRGTATHCEHSQLIPADAGALNLLVGTHGKPTPRIDVPAKVDGSAVFGIDMRLPGMLYAAVAHCPVFGGKVKRYDFAAIKGLPGVHSAVDLGSGVAVVAKSYWQAAQAV